MGSMYAAGIAETDLSLETQIEWHLKGNHYPPIPSSMVTPCVEAIDAYWEDDLDKEITLPEGMLYRGKPTAPAREIIINHHLDAWCTEDEEE